MFDLEKSIAEWRKHMRAAGIKAPVPLEELETHLREEVERQVRLGINAQFAFDVAAKQIGLARDLKVEFSKQSRLRDFLEMELVSKEWGLKWGPVLNLLTLATHTGLLLFCAVMIFFKAGDISGMTVSERASSLAAIAVSSLFVYSGYFGYKLFPVVRKERIIIAIFALVAVPMFVGMMIFLSRVNVRIELLIMELHWIILIPFGVLGGLMSGLGRAAREKTRMASS